MRTFSVSDIERRDVALVGCCCFAAVLRAKTSGSWMGNQVQFVVIVGGWDGGSWIRRSREHSCCSLVVTVVVVEEFLFLGD